MIFLIEYLRAKGQIVSITSFANSDRKVAERNRLDAELKLLGRHVDHEVVLLEAENEEALRKTHRRYFESVRDLARMNSN